MFRAFCLGCDHHSSLSDKHSGAYNWADIQPECVIFFFLIVLAVDEYCSDSCF